MSNKEVKLDDKKQEAEDQIMNALLDSDVTRTKDVHIARLGIDVTIKGLTSPEIYQVREQSKFGPENQLNAETFNSVLIKTGSITPNWGDKRLQDKFNVSDALGVINHVLLAGEAETLAEEILRLSGYFTESKTVKN